MLYLQNLALKSSASEEKRRDGCRIFWNGVQNRVSLKDGGRLTPQNLGGQKRCLCFAWAMGQTAGKRLFQSCQANHGKRWETTWGLTQLSKRWGSLFQNYTLDYKIGA